MVTVFAPVDHLQTDAIAAGPSKIRVESPQRSVWPLLRLVTALQLLNMASAQPNYLVGTGISDITGPASDVNMMGYAMIDQVVSGISNRLYARAFLFADPANDSNRFVFVNMDACMTSQAVSQMVFKRLKVECQFGLQRHLAVACTTAVCTHAV